MEEDVGSGDLSSVALAPAVQYGKAVILAKERGILAGLPVAKMVFRRLDKKLKWKETKRDGELMEPGQIVAELEGKLRAILAGERVALNFLQRMSGIATLTARFAAAVRGTRAAILDTRKTAPGLRELDKYAVRTGGGGNHRFGLYDGILLKDNHIRAAGGVREAVIRARHARPRGMKVEVETTTLREVDEALAAGADIIMLDNMAVPEMREAVRRVRGRTLVEASGGVSLPKVRRVARTGVDYISVGALTHSARALDLSLEVIPE